MVEPSILAFSQAPMSNGQRASVSINGRLRPLSAQSSKSKNAKKQKAILEDDLQPGKYKQKIKGTDLYTRRHKFFLKDQTLLTRRRPQSAKQPPTPKSNFKDKKFSTDTYVSRMRRGKDQDSCNEPTCDYRQDMKEIWEYWRNTNPDAQMPPTGQAKIPVTSNVPGGEFIKLNKKINAMTQSID